jgi:hypothetical protein
MLDSQRGGVAAFPSNQQQNRSRNTSRSFTFAVPLSHCLPENARRRWGEPDLLNGPALVQRRHRDADKPILLRAFKHQLIDAAGRDHESLLSLQQLGESTDPGYAAADHDGQPVADLLDFGQQMRAQEDGLSRRTRAQQDLAHLDAANGIERRGRFIQNQELRIIDECLRQADPLQHSARKLGDIAPGSIAKVNGLEHLLGALQELRVAHSVQCAIEPQQCGWGTMVQSHVLSEKPDATAGRDMPERVSQQLPVARVGKHQPDGDVHGSGLACAVRAQEAENLSLLHAQGEAVQRLHLVGSEQAAVFLGDVVELEGRDAHISPKLPVQKPL